MDPVKPLVSIAGGFRQLTAADLVAMNGALISITETGASTAKALPDALAGKLNTNGTIRQATGGGEVHPWEVTHGSPSAIAYLFSNENSIGLYDTVKGTIWSYNYTDTGNFYVCGQKVWHAGNFNPATKFDKTGGPVAGTVTAGDSTQSSPVGIILAEAGVSGNNSRFAALNIGSGWQIGQDPSRSGVKDFFLYSVAANTSPFLVSAATGILDFKLQPTLNGNQLWSGADPLTPSKAINFRSKTFNIADYGSAPGASDATSAAANLNALNQATADLKASPSGTGTILIPNATHYLQNQYVTYFAQGGSLIGAGHNSALFFNGSNDPYGVVFHQDTNANYYSRLYLANLQIYARNCPNLGQGRLLSMRGTGVSGGLNAESLWVNGDTSAIPSAYIAIINGGTGQFKNLIIEGNQGAYGTSGTGYFISSDVLSTDLSMIACNVNRVGIAYQLIGGSAGNANLGYTLEGVNFIQCIAVGVQQGVLATCPNYRCPLFYWLGGHINAQSYAFNLSGLGTVRIEAAQPQLDYNNNPQALVYATNVSSMRVAGNQFIMVDQLNSGKAPPVVPCVVLGSGCDNWQVVDNTMVNFQPTAPGVWNQNNAATNLYVGGNIKPGKGSNPLVAGTYTDMGYNVGN